MICRYIDLSNPNPPIYPAKTGDLMQALYLEAYAGGEIFGRLVRPLFHQKIIGPMMFNRPTDQAEVELLMSDVQPKIFSYLESQAQRKFLAGDALSIGDISVASNLINYQYLGLRIDPGRHPGWQTIWKGSFASVRWPKLWRQKRLSADKYGARSNFLNERRRRGAPSFSGGHFVCVGDRQFAALAVVATCIRRAMASPSSQLQTQTRRSEMVGGLCVLICC